MLVSTKIITFQFTVSVQVKPTFYMFIEETCEITTCILNIICMNISANSITVATLLLSPTLTKVRTEAPPAQ